MKFVKNFRVRKTMREWKRQAEMEKYERKRSQLVESMLTGKSKSLGE